MLDKLTREDFEKLVGETFEIDFGEAGKLGAKLTETSATTGSAQDREPFSVLFVCPGLASPEQGTYRISHAELGELELFMVPIRGDEDGVVFEAVFA